MRAAIEAFLSACRRPAVLESGEPMHELLPGAYTLEDRNGRLWIEVVGEMRTVSRRVLSVDKQSTAALQCTVQRFGAKPGTLTFLDLDRPQSAYKAAAGARRSFAEQFRRMLSRQFPGWQIATLSSSLDLRRSFSSVFPRACLVRSQHQIAALACPAVTDEPAFLTFALVWFHHLRSNAKTGMRISLALFLPDRAGNLTAHRLRWLSGGFEITVFRFNEHGSAGIVDPLDLGNLETRVQKTAFRPGDELLTAFEPGQAHESSQQDSSERSFEFAVRRNIHTVEATLLPEPVHSQVLAFAAGDRDLIDLLAVDTAGRLTILELKVAEDIHLPVQALDYWMRIKWHAERNELQHLFHTLPLANVAPRLLLVAPAISFHSSCATVLRYFSSEIEVERVGVNSEWRDVFRTVLRLNGGADPISHRSPKWL